MKSTSLIPIPTVSIVMSVYNGQRYLCEALNSLLEQTLQDFELVIVDDGSTDETSLILDAYEKKDKRIFIIRNEQNLGVAASLNRGLQICRAPLVARADADDVFMPERLAKQLTYINQNPNVGVVGSAYQEIDENGQTLKDCEVVTEDRHLKFKLLFGCIYIHPTTIFRRDLVLNAGGYDEKNFGRGPEDYDLWARLLSRTRFGNINEPLVKYRVYSNSVIGKFDNKRWRQYFSVTSRLFSTYAGRALSIEEAMAAAMLHGWAAKMNKQSITTGIDLLHEVRNIARNREAQDTFKLFEQTVSRSLVTQSGIQVYTDRLLSLRLFSEAIRWDRRIAMTEADLMYAVRWLTPDTVRRNYKKARDRLKSTADSKSLSCN